MDLRQQLQQTLGTTYTLDRELGGGGMSRVFVAQEMRLGRMVVVKVLTPELTASISADRFEREIRLAASLQQANIVPLLSAGETDGLPYYTMPYVEGESLRQRLNVGGPMPIAETINVLRDVARALGYAHDRGVVHRDIKPDNVLLSGGAAVVTDFGIAKALTAARTEAEGATLTQTGMAIGTPAYIAPEQAAGDPSIDRRADVYSFGCMAYELLTARPPFADRTPQRMMAAHMTEAPKPITELRADLPEPLARMVMRCLEKDPAARPQSASELMAALDSASTSGAAHSAMPAVPAVLIGDPRLLWRALATYVVSFVAVAVLAKAAIVGVGLPDWVLPGALIVMALGLPVILFTGYSQYVARRAITATPTYTPAGSIRPPTQGTMATLAMKASPHLSWRRSMFGGVYALGAFALLIGAFMALRALGIGPVGSLLAAGRFSSKAPIVIADFTTANTDSSLGAVVSDAVRAGLGQSHVISLVGPAQIASTLRLMRRDPVARLDLTLARDVAQRNGVQAIVDGTVTGVTGGYIITLRLVSADSGAELASFRESGDGPRGLIDAADKLARELRGRIGESFRNVQATPPLARVTTSSLEALRAYSSATRANNVENDPEKAVSLWREAVRLDTSFAAAWVGIATGLNNVRGPRASIDSALEHAYRDRDRLTESERARITASYFANGPHRDRGRAAALFLESSRTADRRAASLVNLGEVLRSWRDFAGADSLNRLVIAIDSTDAIAWGNLVQVQLDRGLTDSAATTLARAARALPNNGGLGGLAAFVAYAKGDLPLTERLLDSLMRRPNSAYRQRIGYALAGIADVHGELARAAAAVRAGSALNTGKPAQLLRDSLRLVSGHAWFAGANAADVARIDAALAQYPLRTLAITDRPYFDVMTDYARAGSVTKAKATLAMYRAEVTDTAMLRLQSTDLHRALGEIALAAHDAPTAIAEFRRADVEYDGKPPNECAPCAAFNLARAYDAANMTDSTIDAYERFINTRYFNRLSEVDGLALAGAHKRLGELYAVKGDTARAIAHFQRFLELWKNADPELQPIVTEARRRLALLVAREPR